MASMSPTIQEPVFDEEVIPANGELNSHFDTKLLSKQPSTSESFDNEITEFPKVKLRTGKLSVNLKIMNAVVHCQEKYKLSENDVIGFRVDFGNMAFDQNWYRPKQDKLKQDQKNITETGTEEKENVEADNVRYQFPS